MLRSSKSLWTQRVKCKFVSNEIEAQCVASVLMGDLMVAVVTEGRARASWYRLWIGERAPFSAPFGAPFAAYGDDDLRHRWMKRRSGASTSSGRIKRLEHALEQVRERGYSVGRESEMREQSGRARGPWPTTRVIPSCVVRSTDSSISYPMGS